MILVNMVVTHFLFSSFTASNALKFLEVQHVKCEYVGLQKESRFGKLEIDSFMNGILVLMIKLIAYLEFLKVGPPVIIYIMLFLFIRRVFLLT